jgi:hypothetical protein
MKLKITNTQQIQMKLTKDEYIVLKYQLKAISLHPVEIDSAKALQYSILAELYKEKNFNIEGHPSVNGEGFITISLKVSQAIAIRQLPLMLETENEWIIGFVDDLQYQLAYNLGKIDTIKLEKQKQNLLEM